MGIFNPYPRLGMLSRLEGLAPIHQNWATRTMTRILGGKPPGRPPGSTVGKAGEVLPKAPGKVRRAFVSTTKPTTAAILYDYFKTSPKDTQQQAFANAVKQFQIAANNPEIEDNAKEILGSMATEEPELAKALAEKTRATFRLLAEKAPEVEAPIDSLFPSLYRMEVGPQKREEYESIVEAALDPLTALERAATGTLTPAAMEVLDRLHGDMVGKFRMDLLDAIQSDDPPPWNVRYQLGIILHMPTDPTQTPEYLASVQEMHDERQAELEKSMQPKPSGRTFGPTGVHISSTYDTRLNKLERGEHPD